MSGQHRVDSDTTWQRCIAVGPTLARFFVLAGKCIYLSFYVILFVYLLTSSVYFRNRNIIKVPIAQRTSQSAVLIKESKYAAQRITTGTYTFQVRHNSNTVSMPEVLEHVPVGNAPTETEVKPFEDIPGPPPLSAFGTMIQQLPSGRYFLWPQPHPYCKMRRTIQLSHYPSNRSTH